MQQKKLKGLAKGVFINYERGGMGDLRGGSENFLHRKGGGT